MERKELHIISEVLNSVLDEKAKKALTLRFSLQSQYEIFLATLLDILIGKSTSVSLNDFLNLYNLEGKEKQLKQKSAEIIESIAELRNKDYNSEYTEWLAENKNEIFLTHITFLREIKTALSNSERLVLKNRLANIEKMDSFDLSEKEIKAGIKINERARLKKHFSELDKDRSRILNSNDSTQHNRKRVNFTSVLILLIISSIAFAIINPTIRNFIKIQYHKIFDKPNELEIENKNIDIKPAEQPILDSVKEVNIVEIEKYDSISSSHNKNFDLLIGSLDTTNRKETKIRGTGTIKSNPYFSTINKTEKDYTEYFKANKNVLDPIEGVWMLNAKRIRPPIGTGTPTSGSNRSYDYKFLRKCVIVRISQHAFELLHLNEDGSIFRSKNRYFITQLTNAYKYKFEISQGKEISYTSYSSKEWPGETFTYDCIFDSTFVVLPDQRLANEFEVKAKKQ